VGPRAVVHLAARLPSLCASKGGFTLAPGLAVAPTATNQQIHITHIAYRAASAARPARSPGAEFCTRARGPNSAPVGRLAPSRATLW